jgi:type II secretion system protein N
VRQISIGQILRWLGYPIFFFLCFVFFAYRTFPYDRLGDRLIQEAQARGYELEIVDLTNSGLTGLTFENLRVTLPSEGEDTPPVDLVFDELTVSTSLFSLMSDTKTYGFDAELAGGEVEGELTLGVDNMEVDVELDDIDLEALPMLRKFTKVPLAGVLNGEVTLVMPSEVAESTGDVEITIEGLHVGDGESKLEIPGWGGLTLDKADAGNLELVVVIEEGSAKIERATSHGEDLAFRAQPHVSCENPRCVQESQRQSRYNAGAGVERAQGRTDHRRRHPVYRRWLVREPSPAQSGGYSAVRSAQMKAATGRPGGLCFRDGSHEQD